MCASSIQVYATRTLAYRHSNENVRREWRLGGWVRRGEGRKEGRKEKRGGEGARVGGRSLNIKVGTDPSHV